MDEALCSRCGQVALFKCERCFEPYCSSQCQISDWPQHKTKCYKFPNLIPLSTIKSLSGSIYLDRNNGIQRRPYGSTYSLNDTRRTSSSNSSKPKPKRLLNDNDFNMVVKSSSPLESNNVSNGNTRCDAVVSIGMTSAWRTVYPLSEGFFDALIKFKEETDDEKRIVWVTDLKYENSLRKLLTEINYTVNQKVPCNPEDIYEGALVAVPLEKVLYRAVVLESSPEMQKATVRLIDYGNELRVPYSQIFASIPIMTNLNAYAFRVCLPDECSPVEVESVLTIRIVGGKEVDDYYNVECKMKSIPLHLPIEVLNKEPVLTMVKCFLDGRNVLLRLSKGGGVEDQAFESIFNSAQSISLDFEYTPNVGAFVAARTPCGWKRARLLGFYEKGHKFLVYAIDEGFISYATQIKKIPESFVSEPIRVFAISTNSPDCMLSEAMFATAKKLNLQLLPTTSSEFNREPRTQLTCSLFDGKRRIIDSVVVSVFSGSLSELGLKLWHENISEDSNVYISHVITYKEVFIASHETKEYPTIFMSEYEKCVPFVTEDTIEKTDIVVYYNSEEKLNYCRGQIIGIENGKYRVLNIDSGSEQIITRDCLRKPTQLVCSLPVHCYRVTLMFLGNIPTPVAYNKALEALEICMKNGVEFKVAYGEKRSVDLLFITKERQSLCKKLLPMVFEPITINSTPTIKSSKLSENTTFPLSPPITPVTVQLPEVGKKEIEVLPAVATKTNHIFTIDDLDVIPIACGDKVPLYVLDSSTILNVNNPYITAADYSNKECLTKMEECLLLVGEYCKSDKAPKNGYAPRKMEICLSVFAEDGEWYRALCIEQKANDNFIVMFLDYGNLSKVNKKDIMPITPDLMFPSNANMVYVEGITSKEREMALIKTIQKNPIIYANVTRLDDTDAYVANILN